MRVRARGIGRARRIFTTCFAVVCRLVVIMLLEFFFFRIYILSRTIFFFFHHLVFFLAMAMKVMVCMIWGSKEYFVHECYVWLLGYMWKLFIHAILTFWDLFFDTCNDSINFQECFSEILIFIRDQRTLLSEILNYVKWN